MKQMDDKLVSLDGMLRSRWNQPQGIIEWNEEGSETHGSH